MWKDNETTDFSRATKMPAPNKRFGASGGVTSNNLLWGIDRSWF